MAENDYKPMTDADTAPPADTAFEPAEPIKDAAVGFEPAGGDKVGAEANTSPTDAAPAKGTDAKDAPAEPAKPSVGLSQQASDRALAFVDGGKDRATGLLEQVSKMLTDAADQVDGRLGGQYGHYARDAAGTVQGFADQLRDKKPDDLVDDLRGLVRRSPGVAIGAAAAIGFVLARLVSAGLDQNDAPNRA